MTDGVAMSKGKAVGRDMDMDMDMDKVMVMVMVMVSTWENGGHALLSPSHSQTHPDSPKGPLMQITCTLHHCNSSAVLRLLQVLTASQGHVMLPMANKPKCLISCIFA
ncbi:hypothetical protein THAR02_10196 [Trichoderma harzianum]|uniref:Uncharacterized protein n=1 Tax=Trichoderma harzianum TaxID=5544 RepID=A0A0F9WZ49_TRIHA|nr:hypothetical protein THAR02_10196 [Trichoderma harzianum]